MEFFYGIFLKLKKYLIMIAALIICLFLNDYIIFKLYQKKDNNDVVLASNDLTSNSDLLVKNNVNDSTKFAIDIKGEVKKPGVYVVDETMNVSDAIKLAGGLTKSAVTDFINLSKNLTNHMVIIIPKKTSKKSENLSECNLKETQYSNKALQLTCGTNNSDNSILNNDAIIKDDDITYLITNENSNSNNIDFIDSKISINNASLEDLMKIPGIGESKAQKIIDYRSENSFTKIEDIMNVSGIGDAMFEKIKDYITV